jgi:hypothetical protein
MFFRRQKISVPTFSDRLDQLRSLGFTVAAEASGKSRISKGRCAAVIEEGGPGDSVHVNKAGAIVGGDIGLLVHGGYQMLWRTAAGKMAPALAADLKALHAFEEDLREGLGLTSLYNESLGTTCDQHLYDRILDRDVGVPARPWQK